MPPFPNSCLHSCVHPCGPALLCDTLYTPLPHSGHRSSMWSHGFLPCSLAAIGRTPRNMSRDSRWTPHLGKGLPCKAQPAQRFCFLTPAAPCFYLFLSLKRQLFKSIQLPAIFKSKQGLLTRCGRFPRTTVLSILWMSSRLPDMLSFKTCW